MFTWRLPYVVSLFYFSHWCWRGHKSLAPRTRTLLDVLGQATLNFVAVATLLFFFFSVSVLNFATSPNSGVKIFWGFLRSEQSILRFIFSGCASFSWFLFSSAAIARRDADLNPPKGSTNRRSSGRRRLRAACWLRAPPSQVGESTRRPRQAPGRQQRRQRQWHHRHSCSQVWFKQSKGCNRCAVVQPSFQRVQPCG